MKQPMSLVPVVNQLKVVLMRQINAVEFAYGGREEIVVVVVPTREMDSQAMAVVMEVPMRAKGVMVNNKDDSAQEVEDVMDTSVNVHDNVVTLVVKVEILTHRKVEMQAVVKMDQVETAVVVIVVVAHLVVFSVVMCSVFVVEELVVVLLVKMEVNKTVKVVLKEVHNNKIKVVKEDLVFEEDHVSVALQEIEVIMVKAAAAVEVTTTQAEIRTEVNKFKTLPPKALHKFKN
jgi:hypothetical protein